MGELASLQMALGLRRVSGIKLNLQGQNLRDTDDITASPLGGSSCEMMGSIARRSLAAAAEDHMDLRVLKAGNAESQTVGIRMLRNKEGDPGIH